jgi:hypothetical protein
MRRTLSMVLGALAVLLAITCTSTPMPIPPSIEIGFIEMELTDPDPECGDAACVIVRGLPGATDAGTLVAFHRLDSVGMEYPLAASAVSGPGGEFELRIGGDVAPVYRGIFHGTGGTVVYDFAPVFNGGPIYPVEAAPASESLSCLRTDPPIVRFEDVPVGSVESAVVDVFNDCGEEMTIVSAYVLYEPWVLPGDELAVTFRPVPVASGGTTGVVVVYWPIYADVLGGAVLIEALDSSGVVTTVLSVPVRAGSVED